MPIPDSGALPPTRQVGTTIANPVGGEPEDFAIYDFLERAAKMSKLCLVIDMPGKLGDAGTNSAGQPQQPPAAKTSPSVVLQQPQPLPGGRQLLDPLPLRPMGPTSSSSS
jgi:hypothetical protein